MPSEFLPELARRNYTNGIAIFFLLIIFGISNIVFFSFRNYEDVGQYKFFLRICYYSAYVVCGIVALIFSYLIRKVSEKHYLIKMLPVILAVFILCNLCIFTYYVLDLPFSATILYMSIAIVAVIWFTFPPVTVLIIEILVMCMIEKRIYDEWGLLGLSDMIVISMLLLILSLSKWRSIKHDLIRQEMLAAHKEVLESEVDRKSEEIQNQSYELQKQHEKLIALQNNTIISLSNLVENRDSDTGEHVRRTSAYVRLLARKAQSSGFYQDILNDEYIDLLTRAAPMHDIGKIVVSDLILKKPGKLTEEEFEQIKRHTTEGGRIVREVLGDGEDKKYITIATDVATSHHERWDGKGYPYRLSRDEIPLSARIMAVADVFDALVSPRCYKEPFSVSKAFEIIKEESGSHFDPVLAELFTNMQDDVVAVMDRYADKRYDLG